jgi:phosphoribosylformylglycinamidine synthase
VAARTNHLTPAQVGLTDAEYRLIRDQLGRDPNPVELGMFGVLWSEHCSYKHSRTLLRRFPTESPRVLQGPGENAGAVDIGDGLAAVMKIESHNHPSAVEPFQGAATGVGGILRDIFAMGARPIALMDALCFGDPANPRTPFLVGGVVGGIGFYGNCIGVPTVGGSIFFDRHYDGNPLVNALCLGIMPSAQLIRAQARGEGNPVLLVGSATGRDGIAGASFASAELSEETEVQRPAVQVGNPFLEKLVLEACLELVGDRRVVAVQDLGAAGLTGAATEVAAHGGAGIEIDVAKVSRRESGMTPYEVMLSESQERMLFVVERGSEDRIMEVFTRWDLHCDVIGRVTTDGRVRVRDGEEVVADLPADVLSNGAPRYTGPTVARRTTSAPESPPFEVPAGLSAVLLRLLGSPNLASRRAVYEQYDHMVQLGTVVPPGEGAAVLRVPGSSVGLALGLGSHPRACALDPWIGGALVVAEACRNVACAGGLPIALTDCLNFGDPERLPVWESLVGAIDGMSEACRVLDVPIISGNVSLYNESEGRAIYPTPIVGALGLIADVTHHARATLTEGQEVWLLGPFRPSLAASEYASVIHGWVGTQPPSIDLDLERRLQSCVRELVSSGVVRHATDVSDGGLAVALAELAVASGVGVDGTADTLAVERADALCFGEAPSLIIVSTAPEESALLTAAAERWDVPAQRLGTATGREIVIGDLVRVSLSAAAEPWSSTLDDLLKG